MNIQEIPLSQIRPGRFQPRRTFDPESLLELAGSIRDQGLIDPVVVASVVKDALYELIGGERRWRAALALAIQLNGPSGDLADAVAMVAGRKAGEQPDYWDTLFSDTMVLGSITAHVVAVDQDQHLTAVIHNLQRQDLTRLEEAHAFAALRTEYGWSIRTLAEKVGKSKSYVGDTLKLLDLAPAVAAMIDGDADAPLDMTLARELARKLPPEMQPLAAEYVAKRAASGEPVASLKKVIAALARFGDPARWALPETDKEGAPITYPPELRNRSRLIRRILAGLAPDVLARRALDLIPKLYGADYLAQPPSRTLASSWDFSRVANALSDKGEAWPTWAAKEGWTCDTCILADLAANLERNDRIHTYGAPCARLRTDGVVTTCDEFIGPDDPAIIPVQGSISDRIPDDAPARATLRGPLDEGGITGRYWVESWQEYATLYHQAGLFLEQQQAQAAEANKLDHLPEMRDYWQAQGDDTVFELSHFQAHACRKCINHLEGETTHGVPCRWAEKPQIKQGVAVAPEFGVLVSQDGVVVPRCQRFSYREMPAIQLRLGGFKIPDRELIMYWYRLMADRGGTYGRERLIWKPLHWLPGRVDLATLWNEIDDDDVMMTIIHVGLLEAQACASYVGGPVTLANPVGNGAIQWAAMRWPAYTSRQKPPWSYPDGWPLPWEKKAVNN